MTKFSERGFGRDAANKMRPDITGQLTLKIHTSKYSQQPKSWRATHRVRSYWRVTGAEPGIPSRNSISPNSFQNLVVIVREKTLSSGQNNFEEVGYERILDMCVGS